LSLSENFIFWHVTWLVMEVRCSSPYGVVNFFPMVPFFQAGRRLAARLLFSRRLSPVLAVAPPPIFAPGRAVSLSFRDLSNIIGARPVWASVTGRFYGRPCCWDLFQSSLAVSSCGALPHLLTSHGVNMARTRGSRTFPLLCPPVESRRMPQLPVLLERFASKKVFGVFTFLGPTNPSYCVF